MKVEDILTENEKLFLEKCIPTKVNTLEELISLYFFAEKICSGTIMFGGPASQEQYKAYIRLKRIKERIEKLTGS